MCVFNVLVISHYQCCCSKNTFIATFKLSNISDFIFITLCTKCVKLKALFCNFTQIYCCSKLKYCFLSYYKCCSKHKFSLRPFQSTSLYTKYELYSLISHFKCCCSFDALRILIFADSIYNTLYNNYVHSI